MPYRFTRYLMLYVFVVLKWYLILHDYHISHKSFTCNSLVALRKINHLGKLPRPNTLNLRNALLVKYVCVYDILIYPLLIGSWNPDKLEC